MQSFSSEEVEFEIKFDKDLLTRVFVLQLFRRKDVYEMSEFKKYVKSFCSRFGIKEVEFWSYVIDLVALIDGHSKVVLTDRGRKVLELMDVKSLLKRRGVDNVMYGRWI